MDQNKAKHRGIIHNAMACGTLFTVFLLVSIFFPTTEAAYGANLTVYFSANGSATWTNNNHSILPLSLADDSFARLILHDSRLDEEEQQLIHYLNYGCGFYCRRAWGGSCQFVILFLKYSFERIIPQVVWSANQDQLVGENATLEFSHGDLALKDENGLTVWSSDTSSQTRTVTGMTLPSSLNLVLFDDRNQTVWQSFDHPSDTLLSGQLLRLGQSLTSSPAPRGSSVGLFSLFIGKNRLTASVRPDGYLYFSAAAIDNASFPADSLRYVSFENGSLRFGYDVGDGGRIITSDLNETRRLPPSQFLRLDSDGNLRIYSWSWMEGWTVAHSFLNEDGSCAIPLHCGYYGLCSQGQCSCPRSVDGIEYFSLYDYQQPAMGCFQAGPFEAQDGHEMVDFGNLNLHYLPLEAAYGILNLEDCKQACLANVSCKAAYFTQEFSKRCYLPSHVLTVIPINDLAEASLSSAYLKVRVRAAASPPSLSPLSPPKKAKSDKILALALVIVAPITFVLAIVLAIALWRRLSGWNEDLIGRVPGMPVSFSYKDLCVATADFSEKIGRGGFGTVFRGVLSDGRAVAVKRLHSDGQGTEDFVAEVQTIGSIHHINLVQLIGYCAERTHRLLVYEYMSNGSLDKWIFGSKKQELDWKTKLKIITDIAKGLAYLHEECRQSIVHLDMKPHNVLLDDKFNAKISDFGLATVMARDQSQISTTLRGTLGYLAPEWQASEHITVKVDIYSFGIVLLEILCGRKNLDYDQQDSRIRLLSLLFRKQNDSKVMDVVYNPLGEVHCHEREEEALRLIRIGLWCLHDDYKKRPSMSTVVKALEGASDLEGQISCQVSHTMIPSPNNGADSSSPGP